MPKGPTVVIIGASAQDEALLRQHAEAFGKVLAVEQDAAQGLDAVRQHSPAVAILVLAEDVQATFALAAQIRASSATAVMIASRDRDPDKILQAMRAGAKDFAYYDDSGADDVGRAIKNLGTTPQATPAAPSKRGTVVAVFGCKGGSGATTIATSLSGALLPEEQSARMGQVVLLDVDFQMGDVLIFLDIASRYTWRDLISNLHRLDEDLLHQSLTTHQTGLHVVAQSDALEEADDIEPAGVAKAVAFLRKHFEFVVIDGLRDFRETSLLVLDMADRIILTMTQDVPALKNANRCIGVLRQLGYDRNKLKLVVNRHARGDKLDEDSIADALGIPVDATVANDFPTVIKAVNQGTLLVDMAPRARVTKDIRALVPLVRGEQPPPRRRGLFGRG